MFYFHYISWNWLEIAWQLKSVNMASDCREDENYLPDLNNELAGEQIMLQQRVFRTNQAFIKVNEEIIAWFKSSPEHRAYPES